jgi:hypothetical protein
VAGGLLRFKREFRTLERLRHPNLVRLHELVQEAGGGWLYTMECIDGVDLYGWCRWDGASATPAGAPPATDAATLANAAFAGTLPVAFAGPADAPAPAAPQQGPGRFSRARAAVAMPQLLRALAHVHAHGIVHRDLKPSNVLVRADGVLKLLDFGVLGLAGRPPEEIVYGTPQYMAPEQVRGETPTPATDLYALGMVLWELALGRVPFEGAPADVMARQLAEPPPDPGRLAGPLGEEGARTVVALLGKDAAARPTLQQVADRLLPSLGVRERVAVRSEVRAVHEPVGREREELSALRRLLRVVRGEARGRAGLVVSAGAGAGRSTFLARLARHLERAGVTVVRGAPGRRELVAFNAVDAIVDGLADELSRVPAARLPAAADSALVATLFPVVAQELPGVTPADPAPPRLLAFAALARWVGEAARALGGVVAILDDLQWADADSVALLDELLRAPPPRFALLSSISDEGSEAGARPADGLVAASPALERLELRPLPPEAVEAILRRHAGSAGAEPDPAAVAALVRASAGIPALAERYGRALAAGGGAADLDGLLARSVAGLPVAPATVLVMAALGEGALRVADVAAASSRTTGEVDEALAELAARGLAHTVGGAGTDLREQRIDVADAHVRAAVVGGLADERRRSVHAQLAAALHARGAPPEDRVRHLLGAGAETEAAVLAAAVADAAAAKQAHALAADLYGLALRHGAATFGAPEARRLRAARATALERVGRYAEAADEHATLGGGEAGAPAAARADARLEEALARFAAGDLARGQRVLDEGLALQGAARLSRGRARALLEALGFLRGPQRLRVAPGAAVAARALQRDARIALLVAYFDPLGGVRRIREVQRSAAVAGDIGTVAMAETNLAYYSVVLDRRDGPLPLYERYRASMLEYRARTPDPDPELVGFPDLLDGVVAQREARWEPARRALARAGLPLDAAGRQGDFAWMIVHIHRAMVESWAERPAGLRAEVQRAERETRRGAQSAVRVLTLLFGLQLHLFEGADDAIDRSVSALEAAWPEEPPTQQRFFVDLYLAQVERVRGHPAAARARLQRALARDARFQLLRTMYAGVVGAAVATAEAQAALSGDPAASVRRALAHARIATAAPRMTQAIAWRAAAFAEEAAGRLDAARKALHLARDLALRLEQPFSAAAAAWHVARLAGDAAGRRRAEDDARAAGFSASALADGWSRAPR